MLPDSLRDILKAKADAPGWVITPHNDRMREYSIKTSAGNERYAIRVTVFSAHTPGEKDDGSIKE